MSGEELFALVRDLPPRLWSKSLTYANGKWAIGAKQIPWQMAAATLHGIFLQTSRKSHDPMMGYEKLIPALIAEWKEANTGGWS